tara:strand:+ start:455 stop:655 length:201 start_codon:yes stop_codon:yes gene_type:complete
VKIGIIILCVGNQAMKFSIDQNMKSYETPLEFTECVCCHRWTSKNHTLVLFEEGHEEIRICYWCDN